MTDSYSEHITEESLSLLVIEPGQIDAAERDRLEQHLAVCALCRERVEALRLFHDDFVKNLRDGPTDRDRGVARRLTSEGRSRWLALPEHAFSRLREQSSLAKTPGMFVEILDPRRTGLVPWFLRHVQAHPVRFAAGGVVLAAAIVALSLFSGRGPSDTNPVRFVVKDRFLSVFNKEGGLLWTRHVPGVRDGADTEFNSPTQPGARLVGIEDIDGRGRNVVLLSSASSFALDTLFCIEGDGTLRWSAWAGGPIRFGKNEFTAHAQMGFYSFQVTKRTVQGSPGLYAVVRSTQYFPSKLVKMDPLTGRTLETYWHPGVIEKVTPIDVDGHGREELVIGGFNQLYGMAFVALLDQTPLSGCGPAPEESFPAGIGHSGEEYYMLFPRTDLGKLLSPEPFNNVRGIVPGAWPFFQVYVNEGRKDTSELTATLVYTLDSTMHVVAAAVGNTFELLHAEYFAQGKLSRACDRAYREELRRSVLYWDGERFVDFHAMNRRHTGASALLQ